MVGSRSEPSGERRRRECLQVGVASQLDVQRLEAARGGEEEGERLVAAPPRVRQLRLREVDARECHVVDRTHPRGRE